MWILLSSLVVATGCYLLFRDTLNRLQYIGFVYWITRDNGKKGDPFLSVGFMRQTASPWKVGKGVQVRLSKYTVQVGVCRSNKSRISSEADGLLHAMGGRLMEEDAATIRRWK
jgi:hypothetical protein